MLGEQGFVGLALFLGLFSAGFLSAGRTIKKIRLHSDLKWADMLLKMLQVSLVGYAVGGLTLGLAYFDLPYHILSLIVITRLIVEKQLRMEDQNNESWERFGRLERKTVARN